MKDIPSKQVFLNYENIIQVSFNFSNKVGKTPVKDIILGKVARLQPKT